jgi:CRISPR-associated endonuclease Csn1
MNNKYYLGLDCGTSSVGWAVTDEAYEILRAKGKALWGIRLFEEAQTAEVRRASRSSRRMTYRKAARLDLLDEFFETEINKIDPNFFTRLKDSKYWLEDKTNSNDKNTLFNDKHFNDVTFHRQYPTIFHLRYELINNPKKHDIRLVYLAIHHLLKNRGHFVYENQEIESVQEVNPLLNELALSYSDIDESTSINWLKSNKELGNILVDKSLKNRARILKDYISISTVDPKDSKKIQGEIIKALLGNKVNLEKLFPTSDIDFESVESKGFEFKSSSYEEKEEQLKSDIGIDYFGIVECLKKIYDWSLLDGILHGNKYISAAKIEVYEEHKKDLKLLKKIVKEYLPDEFDVAFFDIKDKCNNYCKYIGHGLDKDGKKDKGEVKSKCTQEDVNKYFKNLLNPIKEKLVNDEEALNLLNRLEMGIALPKTVTGDNRVIPYQVNLKELAAILGNAKVYLPFLNIKDDEGFSVYQKIIAIMKFRIPYYVGPLVENDGSGKDYQKFSWMVRKENSTGKILPWKFADQVDLPACGNAFIKRMSRKCTYLPNENVLPKNSLLYSEYTVLNEINNLRINGEKPPLEVRDQIYDLFKRYKSVSQSNVKKLLVSIGYCKSVKDILFTGIDIKFNSNLKSYISFKDILENEILNPQEIDEIIEWAVIFSEGQGLLKNKIVEKYGEILTDDNLNHILNSCKSFSGWGNLSRKFLTEMYDVDEDSGECKSVMTLLRETNHNLMELLSDKFSIHKSVDLELNKTSNEIEAFTYESLVEPLLVSPSVKRSIWQTLLVVKELASVMKTAPEKIFIEMARGGDKNTKKKRSVTRKDGLITQYNEITGNSDAIQILNALEKESNDSLRKEKLYLYYSQMGRCMYSNERIVLSDLLSISNRYDIDHIYPQKDVKDNNIDNKVLVKSTENRKKGAIYPLSSDIQKKCFQHWEFLLKHKLITREKFNRLTRKSELTNDELQNFIARQLVETRQSTKAAAKILKRVYPNTKVVFSKAGNVSEFRNEFSFHKARSVNDFHHAKDAYLNIVVGNVYNTKFTENPGFIFKDKNERYNLSKIYYYDVKRYGKVAWIKDTNGKNRRNNNNDFDRFPETGTIVNVRRTMNKNNILFTRQCIQRKGQISDLNLVKRGAKSGVLPIKSSDDNLMNVEKYGGYNSLGRAYMFVAEYLLKSKKIVSFFDIPICKASEIDNGSITLLDYCEQELKLDSPKIIVPKVLINTKVQKDGFVYEISGVSLDSICLKTAIQLIISPENYEYAYHLEKYLFKMKEYEYFHKNDSEADLIEFSKTLERSNNITVTDNLHLLQELSLKLRKTIYRNRATTPIFVDLLNGCEENFKKFNIIDQCKNLEQLMLYFACRYGSVDFSWIGKGKRSGVSTMQRKISKDLIIINQSITGIYETRRLITT